MDEYITLEYETYEEARENFEWDIPADYNAAVDFVRKHNRPDERIALYQGFPDGKRETYTYQDLDVLSNRLARGLRDLGVERGDRVGLMIPQKVQNPVTHLACWKLGAISVPLSVLFGRNALQYRLEDCDAKVLVADTEYMDTVEMAREDCPALEAVVEVGGTGTDRPDTRSFDSVVEGHPDTFDIPVRDREAPALIIYTSGTTGSPKGVLHSHQFFLGHCTAFYMYYERDVFDSTFWTPAGWAWMGGLGDLLFPAFHYGRPVVRYPMGKFDADTSLEILEEFSVTDSFLPPTALRMMMEVEAPTSQYDLDLKAICSGGEALTSEILTWAEETLDDVKVNELYGQTEAGIVCTCHDWFPVRPGSMGKPAIGTDVSIVDPETGTEMAPNEVGEIAIDRTDNPVVFLEYWNQPEKTTATRLDGWHLTGDLGMHDEDGYFWYKARKDEVIITSGYRVGPREVEDTILEHPDVEQAAVIGVPDDIRGEIIKAFVQPVSGVDGDEELRASIQKLVQDHLAKYEHPREIEFRDSLPTTTTGKIRRTELREQEAGFQ
jgi:acetyl-CoA synthetase